MRVLQPRGNGNRFGEAVRCGRGKRSTRRVAVCGAALAAWAGVGFAPRSALALPDLWTGAAGGEWSDAGSWSTGLPQPGDDAINLIGSPIDFNTNSTVNSFSSNGAFTLSGGTLSGSQTGAASTVEVDNTLTFNGGSLNNVTLNAGVLGSIVVDFNGNNFITNCIINADLPINTGYVRLLGANTANSQVTLASGGQIQLQDGNASLLIAAGHSLHGAGLVNEVFGGSTLANSGTVSADLNGATLSLNNSNITGSGVFQAISGGTLSIGGLLNGTSATVNAVTGTVQINGGGLSGSIGATTGSGITFVNNGNNYISGATVNGTLTFGDGSYSRVYNSNAVNGEIAMASHSNGIQLQDGNALLTVGSTGSLHGYGLVYEVFGGSTLSNLGTVNADISGETLSLNNSNITGNGIFEGTGGGTLSIGGTLNGSGATVHGDSGTVLVNGGTITGTFAASTGTGISFANNGNNSISGASVSGNLTFGQGAYAQVFGTNQVGGTIAMASTANGIQLRDGNASLQINSGGGLLRGYGTVYEVFGGSTLINNGTVSGDVSGQTLSLNNSSITGSGIFQGANGGTLAIGGRLTGSGGTVHGDTGTVLVNGGGISGTFAASTGTGISFANNGNNYIIDASVNGNLTFGQGAYTQVFGTNQVGGTIAMASNANGIQLRDGNASLTISPGASLHGYGQVYQVFGGGTLTDNGTISADTSAQVLAINNSNIPGSGVLDARNGGILSIGGQLQPSGMTVNVDANPNSIVEINGGSLTGTLGTTTGTGLSFANNGNNYIDTATVNGTLTFPQGGYAQSFGHVSIFGEIDMASTSNGLQLRDGNADLGIKAGGTLRGFGNIYQVFGGATVTNGGTIAADVAGQILALSNSAVSNTGTMRVDGGAEITVAGSLTQTAGTTKVNGVLALNNTMALQGGTLMGDGNVAGSVSNTGGVVSPGNSPGELTITGNYDQAAGGGLEIELGGYTPGVSYDQLFVSGAASLDGNLNVDMVNGFNPIIGDTFIIMQRNGGSGIFASTTSSDPGFTYTVAYNPTDVEITLTSIPEPGSAVILCIVAGWGLARRRRLSPSPTGRGSG